MLQETDRSRIALVEHVKARHKRLQRYHWTWKDLWREVSDFCMPMESDDIYEETTRGQKRENKLFDSTGVVFSMELASALFAMVVDPSAQFFELTTGRPELDSKREVGIYLQDSAKKIREVLAHSNFSNAVFETFLDLVVYGTAPLLMEASPDDIIRFQSVPIFQTLVDEDQFGVPDAVYREYRYTGKQLLQKFPNRFNEQERQALTDKGLETEHRVLHALERRELFFGKEKSKGLLKYISVYILQAENVLLSDPLEGTKTFQWAVPKFYKTSYEKYGRSPSMAALSDLKSLNVMKRTLLQAIQLQSAPPLQVADQGTIRKIRFKPFSINYRRPGADNKIESLIPNMRTDINQAGIVDTRIQIEQAFLLDKIRVSDKTHQTQQQVFSQQDQGMKSLGAILSRFHSELLKPVIENSFSILEERGLFQEAPEVLRDSPQLKIKFTSQIAKAQRLNEVTSLQQAIAMVGPLAQLNPAVLDNVNFDEAVRIVFDSLGVDKSVMNDSETVTDVRNAQQEASQEIQEQQDAESLVGAVSQLGLGG